MSLRGADISEYQGQVEWDTIKQNLDFVTVRSSYGNGYIDKQFKRNQSEARRVNMLRGYYHYSYPQFNKASDEAQWFIKVLSTLQDGEELDLDFEENYTGDVVAWCKEFLDTVSSLTDGYKPLIYLNPSLIQRYSWTPVINAGYGLWVASYDNDPNGLSFDTPWVDAQGNSIVAFKQYTSSGHVPGIVGPVDMDVMWGDAKTFFAYGYHPNTPTVLTPSAPASGAQTLVDLGDLGVQEIQKIISTLKDQHNTIINFKQKTPDDFTSGELWAALGRKLIGK